MMASVQDSRGNFRRLQTLQNNMERVLAEKFKELDTMNTQVKVCGVCEFKLLIQLHLHLDSPVNDQLV